MGETPFVQVSMTWALTCPETVHQRPCMTREIETWLLDSSVGNNSVVDHRNKYQSSLHCIIVSVCRSTALTLLSEMSACVVDAFETLALCAIFSFFVVDVVVVVVI